MKADSNQSLGRILLANTVAGVGWALGAAVGFTIVAAVLVRIFQALGGLPLIGGVLQEITRPFQEAQPSKEPFFQEQFLREITPGAPLDIGK